MKLHPGGGGGVRKKAPSHRYLCISADTSCCHSNICLSTSELQQKLGQSREKKFYLFKVLRAHILPLTNVAFNKSGSW